jgi:hypothetical protein
MGAERRIGKTFYAGQTVEVILRRWRQALVLVVT